MASTRRLPAQCRHISSSASTHYPRAARHRGGDSLQADSTEDVAEGQSNDDGITHYNGILPPEVLQAIRSNASGQKPKPGPNSTTSRQGLTSSEKNPKKGSEHEARVWGNVDTSNHEISQTTPLRGLTHDRTDPSKHKPRARSHDRTDSSKITPRAWSHSQPKHRSNSEAHIPRRERNRHLMGDPSAPQVHQSKQQLHLQHASDIESTKAHQDTKRVSSTEGQGAASWKGDGRSSSRESRSWPNRHTEGQAASATWGFFNDRNPFAYSQVKPSLQRQDVTSSKKVTRCVIDCQDVSQLSALVGGSLDRLDGAAHCRILHRLGQLMPKDRQATPSPEFRSLVDQVMASLVPKVSDLSSRNTTGVMHALAKLQIQDPVYLQLIMNQAEREDVQARMNAWDRQTLLWSAASLGADLSPTAMRNAALGLTEAKDIGSQTISVALWAFAKRNFFPGADVLTRLLSKAETSDDWSSQSVANMMWALQVLHHKPNDKVIQAVVSHLCNNLNDYPSRATVLLLESLCDCNAAFEKTALDRLSKAINSKATKFGTAQLAIIDSHLERLASLQVPDKPKNVAV